MEKFLVVDDSKTVLKMLTNVFKQAGIPEEDIITAEDGLKAWEIYQNRKDEIGIVFTDWNMPNMNGLELVKKIRENDKTTPIVMVTTEGGREEVIKALKAGVNNYIVKPFNPQVFKQKLREIGYLK